MTNPKESPALNQEALEAARKEYKNCLAKFRREKSLEFAIQAYLSSLPPARTQSDKGELLKGDFLQVGDKYYPIMPDGYVAVVKPVDQPDYKAMADKLAEDLNEALDIAQQNIEDPDTMLIEHLQEALAKTEPTKGELNADK